MIKLNLTSDILSAFYSIVKSKSTYLGFLIRNGQFAIYSELNEIYYLSLCHVDCQDTLSLRLPVETMRCLMYPGTLTIEEVNHNDGHVTEILCNYTTNEKLRCKVEIASEFSDTEALILEFIKAVIEEECTTIDNPKIFESALDLTRVDMKEIGIKGVNINGGKIYTIANGFAAYREEPLGLSLVISTSSLKELVAFCSGRSEVKLLRHNGFNICNAGSNIIAWRRVRNTPFFDIPDVTYEISCTLNVKEIRTVTDYLSTEVSECVLSLKDGLLKISTQVGLYQIPINTINDKVQDIHLNYKLFSKLLKTSAETAILEVNDYTIHLLINGTHYFMGVQQ
jgi:hypothetical protein